MNTLIFISRFFFDFKNFSIGSSQNLTQKTAFGVIADGLVAGWLRSNSLYYKIQSEFDSKDTWSAFGVIADGLVAGWLSSSWPNSLYYEIKLEFDSKYTWSPFGVIADGLVTGWLSSS